MLIFSSYWQWQVERLKVPKILTDLTQRLAYAQEHR
jgi:hypothetical protein